MPPSTSNNNDQDKADNQERKQPTISRLRPSIAQSIIKSQNLSSNIFASASTTSKNQTTQKANPSAFSKFFSSSFQLPLAIPQVTAFGLAMASSSQSPADHHHHHHDSSSPSLEPEAMRRCSMNMIFNTNPIGTCIVFREFYVSGQLALIFYWVLLFLIAIGYEYLRLASQKYDRMIRVRLSGLNLKRPSSLSPRRVSSNENFIADGTNTIAASQVQAWGQISVPRSIQLTRSFFYISNVALSFFLMLVIMTYNAQIILAVLAGAFIGHFIFHREIWFGEPDKGMACH